MTNSIWLEFYQSLGERYMSTHNAYMNALYSKDYSYRIFNLENDFKNLLDVEDEKFQFFAMKAKTFLMIPLKNIHGNAFGFVCRSVNDKSFYNVQINEKLPMAFGLEMLNLAPFQTPILLCEGIKDCMTLRQVYPFSIAYLTAKPSDLLFTFLEQISNRILFFPDNDYAGKKFLYDKEIKFKFEYYDKCYSPFGKDLGEYFDNGEYKDRILEWVKSELAKRDIKSFA